MKKESSNTIDSQKGISSAASGLDEAKTEAIFVQKNDGIYSDVKRRERLAAILTSKRVLTPATAASVGIAAISGIYSDTNGQLYHMDTQVLLLKKVWKGAMVALAAIMMVAFFLFWRQVLASANDVPCIPTDLKGRLEYTGNHLAPDPVIGHFENIAQNPSCADDIFILGFGSLQVPESAGWLESQNFVFFQKVTVSQGATDHRVEIDVPNRDFCWYQVDALRTSEVRIPPRYIGEEIIDYVVVQDADSCITVTPTPTPSPSPGASPSPSPVVSSSASPTAGGFNITNNNTNTNSNTNNNNINIDIKNEQKNEQNVTVNNPSVAGVTTTSVPGKTPETGPSVLGFASIFGASGVGLILSRYGRGRVMVTRKKETISEVAQSIFRVRQDQKLATSD